MVEGAVVGSCLKGSGWVMEWEEEADVVVVVGVVIVARRQ